MQQIRLWEITPEQRLVEIKGNPIPLEERLEDWLESDISVLDSNLLVIGRQVETEFRGVIDLLCLNSAGDTVVIELKKDKTSREVTAQALEYASWVRKLSFDELARIADDYPKLTGSLSEMFEKKFGEELPAELNQVTRSLIVAVEMDAGTRRIVEYLTDLNVPINVATVKHFEDANGREMLAQVFRIEPVEERARSATRGRGVTLADVQARAERNGIGDMFRRMREGTRGVLSARAYSESILYAVRLPDGGQRTVLIVWSGSSEQGQGMDFVLHATRWSKHFGGREEQLSAWLPEGTRGYTGVRWSGSSPEERENARGLEGSFQTEDEVQRFLEGIGTLRQD